MTRSSRSALDSLADLVSASRVTADRQIASLNETVERTSQNVDRAVAAIQQSAQNIELSAQNIQQSAQNMERTADRIEQSANRVEQQVGSLSEHLTAIDIKLDRLIDAISGHLSLANKQADNIADLGKLVAAQAKTAEIQAATVATLISRTA